MVEMTSFNCVVSKFSQLKSRVSSTAQSLFFKSKGRYDSSKLGDHFRYSNRSEARNKKGLAKGHVPRSWASLVLVPRVPFANELVRKNKIPGQIKISLQSTLPQKSDSPLRRLLPTSQNLLFAIGKPSPQVNLWILVVRSFVSNSEFVANRTCYKSEWLVTFRAAQL